MFLPLSYWVEDYPAEKLRRPAGMNFVAFLTSRTDPAAQPRARQHMRRALRSTS